MAEQTVDSMFPGQTYILVRVRSETDDGYDVEFEHSGFPDRDAAFDFLKAVVNDSEEI